MKRATLRVSPELLMAALHLPKNVQCYGAALDPKASEVLLWIKHDSLREVPDGERTPLVVAVLEQEGQKVEFRHFMETP